MIYRILFLMILFSKFAIAQNNTFPTTGNVGVGTLSPEQKLTVKGGIGFDWGASDKKLYSPNDGVLEWMTHDWAGERGFAVSHQGTKRVYLNISGNSYFNGGNLGIGTTNPLFKLDVKTGNNERLLIRSGTDWGGANTGIAIDARNDAENGSIPLRIRTSSLSIDAGNVGIGTTNPLFKLDVKTGINERLLIRSGTDWGGANTGIAIDARNDAGNASIPLRIRTSGLSIDEGNVGIGTSNPGAYKLAVEGTIGARKLKVTQGTWADEVFKSEYKLKPLNEVEQFILNNKHLPGVPSEKQVMGRDIDVGDTQALLLKKIEELTLYIIEINKRQDSADKKIKTLEQANEILKLKTNK